jgi:hypothetical protein
MSGLRFLALRHGNDGTSTIAGFGSVDSDEWQEDHLDDLLGRRKPIRANEVEGVGGAPDRVIKGIGVNIAECSFDARLRHESPKSLRIGIE